MGLKGGWIAFRMVDDGMAIFKGFDYNRGYGAESPPPDVWENGKVEFRNNIHEIAF